MSNKKRAFASLDIGSSYLKAVSGVAQDGRLKITGKAIMPNIPGVYTNGAINDKSKLAGIVEELLHNLKHRNKDVAVTFESNEIIKRIIEIPSVQESDIGDLVKFEITEFLPINIDDYIMQNNIIGAAPGDKLKVSVVAIPETIVSEHFEMLKLAGCRPVLMDIHSTGIEAMLSGSGNIHGNNLIVDIGNNTTNVSVFEAGRFEFNRMIAAGIGVFDVPVEKIAHVGDQQAMDRIDMNAGKTIRAYEPESPDAMSIPEIWDSYRYGELAAVEMEEGKRDLIEEIVLIMDNLLDEIDKIMKYYLNRAVQNRIDEIIIYGGGSVMRGMADVFAKKFGKPVKILNLAEYVTVPENADNPLFINAAATMIGGF